MTRLKIITNIEAVVALGAVAYLAVTAWIYIQFGSYLDHAEPLVAIDSWRVASGGSLFLSTDSEEFTITAYGPLLYLVNAANFSLAGGSIEVSKLPGIMALLGGVGLFSAYVYRSYGREWLGFAIILYIALLLIPGKMSFWVRPEPFLVFLVAVALYGTSFKRPGEHDSLTAGIVIAVSAGLAVNLKIHAPLYFVPLVFGYCLDGWYRRWPIMAVIFSATALAPFALPWISLPDYLTGLSNLAASRSLEPALLAKALKWGVFFYTPILLLIVGLATGAKRPPIRDLVYGIAFVVSVTIALYPSSVAGSGWYHLLPFTAISIDLSQRYAKLLDQNSWAAKVATTALVVAFLTVSITPQKRLHRYIGSNRPAPEMLAEINQFLDRHKDSRVEIGYGSDVAEVYKQSYLKVVPIFAGGKSTISSVAAMEMSYSRQPVPTAKLVGLKNCGVQYWLIPLGEMPFTLQNYFNGERAFWPAYIDTFNKHYVKSKSFKFWDVWTCRKAS